MIRRLVILVAPVLVAIVTPTQAFATSAQPSAVWNGVNGSTLTINPPVDTTATMTVTVDGSHSTLVSPSPFHHYISSATGWDTAAFCAPVDTSRYDCANNQLHPGTTVVNGSQNGDTIGGVCLGTFDPFDNYDPSVTVNAAAGSDTVTGSCSADALNGGDGNDAIRGAGGGDQIAGGSGRDRIDGGPGADVINGDLGDDVIIPGTATDTVNGGDGTDVVSYEDRDGSQPVTIRLTGAPVSGVAGENDTIGTDVENVVGSDAADDIGGSATTNVIASGPGNDVVDPLGGVDVVSSGDGNDVVSARDGRPDFVDCGAGDDSVTADASDVVQGCEHLSLPAPDTGKVSGPKKVAKGAKAVFTFSSPLTAATFECAVDKGAFKSCRSPFKLKSQKLKAGKHTLRVRAVYPTGNPDPSPSSRSFKVVVKSRAK